MSNAVPITELRISTEPPMPLGATGRLALEHWRTHLPEMTARLEAEGRLLPALMEAERMTFEEMHAISHGLVEKRGYTPDQAHDAAWEMVRERYLLLPAETMEEAAR